jgi:putative acetyltransferase
MAELIITVESPRQDDIVALVSALDQHGDSLYPPEANHHLDIETLCGTDISFLVVRRRGAAIGIGALWARPGAGYGEVKRMYVIPEARGLRLGERLLQAIERIAREARIPLLRLETGNRNTEALGLYERAGFRRRGPFGDYNDHPTSVFMEKALD